MRVLVASAVILLSSAALADDAPTFSKEEVEAIYRLGIAQGQLQVMQEAAKPVLQKLAPRSQSAGQPPERLSTKVPKETLRRDDPAPAPTPDAPAGQ